MRKIVWNDYVFKYNHLTDCINKLLNAIYLIQ
jgi:hypothetical protein